MKQNVRVWDAPIRLFHWALPPLIGFMWYSGEQGGEWLLWHIRVGYVVATLLLFRLIWGLIGSQTARFTQFIRGPKAIWAYMRGQLPEDQIPGHNPLGALMVMALLAALLFQVVSGMLSSDIDSYMYDGPLIHLVGGEWSEQITVWHKQGINYLLALVAVHIGAVLFYLWGKKTNLIRPMVTGIKPIDSDAELDRVEFIPPIIALVTLVVSAGAIYTLVTRL